MALTRAKREGGGGTDEGFWQGIWGRWPGGKAEAEHGQSPLRGDSGGRAGGRRDPSGGRPGERWDRHWEQESTGGATAREAQREQESDGPPTEREAPMEQEPQTEQEPPTEQESAGPPNGKGAGGSWRAPRRDRIRIPFFLFEPFTCSVVVVKQTTLTVCVESLQLDL